MALRPGITALIPTFGEDVVAIFIQSDSGDDQQVLQDAHLMQVSMGEQVTTFKHPLENGRSLVDHRIIQPVTIELRIILTESASILGALLKGSLDFEKTVQDVYNEMRALHLDGTLLSIQTRTGIYPNQTFNSMPHEETSSIFNGVVISVGSEEIFFETANKSFAAADEDDTDTAERGKQNPLGIPSLSDIGNIFGVS